MITRTQQRKLLRLVGEYGGACAANAIVQNDAEGDASEIQALARREQRREDTRLRRLKAYIASLTQS